jgi:hypothetical protein
MTKQKCLVTKHKIVYQRCVSHRHCWGLKCRGMSTVRYVQEAPRTLRNGGNRWPKTRRHIPQHFSFRLLWFHWWEVCIPLWKTVALAVAHPWRTFWVCSNINNNSHPRTLPSRNLSYALYFAVITSPGRQSKGGSPRHTGSSFRQHSAQFLLCFTSLSQSNEATCMHFLKEISPNFIYLIRPCFYQAWPS